MNGCRGLIFTAQYAQRTNDILYSNHFCCGSDFLYPASELKARGISLRL